MAGELYDPSKHGELIPVRGPERYDPAVHDELVTTDVPKKRQLEFPEAPTYAGETLRNVYDNGGLSGIADYLKGGFGTLLTDDPIARAQILLKQLPGAIRKDDKFGNPMIEWKGKRYYMSRPGEIDAADLSRAGAGIAATVPAMIAAPAGIAGAAAVGGLTNVGMSMGEDVLARKLGGTNQQVDPTKAAVSGAFGVAAPAVVGGAGRLLSRSTGRVQEGGEAAGRRALGREFNVRQTAGQISDDTRALSLEDNLRHARSGQAPAIMRGFDEAQQADIDAATAALRSRMTGAPAAMSADDIGDVIGQRYQAERQAARTRVSNMYDRAFNPDELAAAGIRGDVPIESVYGLRNAIETAFIHGPQPMIPTPELTPATYRAIQMINDFSQTGGIPSAFPRATMPPAGAATGEPLVTGISWRQMDQLRKHLNGLRTAARTNPADLVGMRHVLDVFDDSMGRLNPLLNDARLAHAERVARFDPQRDNASGVNTFLGTLSNEANPGKLIHDRLFNSNAIKNGTAGPMLRQLSEIVGNSPQSVAAIREGMLNRLMVNLKTGEAYSPKVAANNIRDALNGQSSSAYRMVFQPDELAQLGRYRELLDQVGTTRAAQNPSKTSYNLLPGGRKLTGGGLGALIGHSTGIPAAEFVGGMVGGAIGDGVGNRIAVRQAQRAITGTPVGPRTSPGINRATNAAVPGSIPAGSPGLLSLLFPDEPPKRKR